MFPRNSRACFLYAVPGLAASFTSLSGRKLVDGLPPACNYEILKNMSRKNNAIWSKDFFTRGLYNNSATFVGLSRDLPDSFHQIAV